MKTSFREFSDPSFLRRDCVVPSPQSKRISLSTRIAGRERSGEIALPPDPIRVTFKSDHPLNEYQA
jgi:hypothetical protein